MLRATEASYVGVLAPEVVDALGRYQLRATVVNSTERMQMAELLVSLARPKQNLHWPILQSIRLTITTGLISVFFLLVVVALAIRTVVVIVSEGLVAMVMMLLCK